MSGDGDCDKTPETSRREEIFFQMYPPHTTRNLTNRYPKSCLLKDVSPSNLVILDIKLLNFSEFQWGKSTCLQHVTHGSCI